jgi:hypothetical protein
MPKRNIDGELKTSRNLLHEYHNIIDPQTGKIDQTDFRLCKCKYCSVWTPEVIKAYNEYLIEEEAKAN